MYEGMVDEGLAIVQAVRARHDGIARNPWNEFECGHHYARAMSSWSLLLALSGYHYSAPAGRLSFAPLLNAGNFRCFFSTGGAWGSYSQKLAGNKMSYTINVRYGTLALRTLQLALPEGVGGANVSASTARGRPAIKATVETRRLTVDLGQGITIGAGEMLSIGVW